MNRRLWQDWMGICLVVALLVAVPWSLAGIALANDREKGDEKQEEEIYKHESRKPSLAFSPKELEQKLGLSETQVQDLKRILTEYRKGVILKRAAIRAAEVELAAMLDQKSLDRAALEQKVEEIASATGALLRHRVAAFIEMHDMLDEDQRATFKALLLERMRHMGRAGGFHGMRGFHGM